MKQYQNTPYFITEDGKVFRNGKQLKSWGKDYPMITFSINNNRIAKYIHRLVGEVFLENSEGKSEINHIDGNKFNNHFSNLEWVTSAENKKHKHHILKKGIGEKHGLSKLSNSDVEYIRKNYIPRHRKFGMRALSKHFNVNAGTIHSVIHNKTWIKND